MSLVPDLMLGGAHDVAVRVSRARTSRGGVGVVDYIPKPEKFPGIATHMQGLVDRERSRALPREAVVRQVPKGFMIPGSSDSTTQRSIVPQQPAPVLSFVEQVRQINAAGGQAAVSGLVPGQGGGPPRSGFGPAAWGGPTHEDAPYGMNLEDALGDPTRDNPWDSDDAGGPQDGYVSPGLFSSSEMPQVVTYVGAASAVEVNAPPVTMNAERVGPGTAGSLAQQSGPMRWVTPPAQVQAVPDAAPSWAPPPVAGYPLPTPYAPMQAPGAYCFDAGGAPVPCTSIQGPWGPQSVIPGVPDFAVWAGLAMVGAFGAVWLYGALSQQPMGAPPGAA